MANTAFNWIIEKLGDNDKIKSTNVDNDGLLHIERVDGIPLRVITSPLEIFKYKEIKPLADIKNVDFILHTFK